MKQILWPLVAIVLCIVLYWIFLRRTPESIIKTVFDINMSEFAYSVDSFEEQWFPNGDGHIYIVIKFEKLTPQNIAYLKSKYAKPLPIPEELKSKVPYQFSFLKKGYYFYSLFSETNEDDYKILIFNLETNEAILYLVII